MTKQQGIKFFLSLGKNLSNTKSNYIVTQGYFITLSGYLKKKIFLYNKKLQLCLISAEHVQFMQEL